MIHYPWEILFLAAVLLLNRAALRASWSRPWLFWLIQGLDGLCLGWLLLHGLSGLEHIPAANWMVAALIVFHMIQNFNLRTRSLQSGRAHTRLRQRMQKAHTIKPPSEGEA